MSKDAIFDKVQSYFSYNYVDGNSVIQAKDKESGYIIGRGYYLLCDDMYKYVKAEHIIKVDCKDGRIRVIITVNNYDEDGLAFPPDVHGNRHRNVMITTMYPFTKWNNRSERLTKDEKIHDEAFASLIGKVNAVFDDLKKTINKGSSVLDIDGW